MGGRTSELRLAEEVWMGDIVSVVMIDNSDRQVRSRS